MEARGAAEERMDDCRGRLMALTMVLASVREESMVGLAVENGRGEGRIRMHQTHEDDRRRVISGHREACVQNGAAGCLCLHLERAGARTWSTSVTRRKYTARGLLVF